MKPLIQFTKKFPILIVILTFGFIFCLLWFVNVCPESPVSFGLNELIMAVCVFVWTFLFMGKDKVRFKPDGFRYAFRYFRLYLIVWVAIALIFVAYAIYSQGGLSEGSCYKLMTALLVGLTVGIVEEFSFRGLVFGGLLQKLGNSKKGVILAAVISSFLFGLMHTIIPMVNGEVNSLETILTSSGKIIQTGVMGMVVAFAYYKTRNLYTVALFHGVNDLLQLLCTLSSENASVDISYVNGDAQTGIYGLFIMYGISIVMMIPMLIKGIKDVKADELVPFDDGFLPRAVKYEKRAKKNKKENQ